MENIPNNPFKCAIGQLKKRSLLAQYRKIKIEREIKSLLHIDAKKLKQNKILK